MSSLVIFFVAILAAIDPLSAVNSKSSSGIDLNAILNLVQKQRNDDTTDTDTSTGSDISSTSLDESSRGDALRYGRLRKADIIDLLDKVANANNNVLQSNDRTLQRQVKSRNTINRNQNRGNVQRDNNLQSQIIDQLLSRGINNEERKAKLRLERPRKRLKPNRLLPDLSNLDQAEYKESNILNGIEDYSKVYVVLNPESLSKNKNKNSLNELVSKLLALPSAPSRQGQNNQVNRNKPRRYKGFVVRDQQLSRRSRGSRERSAEYEHRPKRLRGGSMGGTAIPYLHPRGNIYEKEND